MNCPICGKKLDGNGHYVDSRHFPDSGLPENWYSHTDGKPQDGGSCANCNNGIEFMTLANGDIYSYGKIISMSPPRRVFTTANEWHLFKLGKPKRTSAKPIGGFWVE